jgi:hypothetical protein
MTSAGTNTRDEGLAFALYLMLTVSLVVGFLGVMVLVIITGTYRPEYFVVLLFWFLILFVCPTSLET